MSGFKEIKRVTRTRQQAQKNYDKISSIYDLIEGSWEKKFRKIGLQKLNPVKGQKILQIGVGTGHDQFIISKSIGKEGTAVGIDISLNMLLKTKSQLRRIYPCTILTKGDALLLPLKNNIFDSVYMSFVLELFDTPEIPVVLHECRRVLKDKGKIVVITLSNEKETKMEKAYLWGHDIFPSLLDCRPINAASILFENKFRILESQIMSMIGLPVEIVLASK